jgi:hypothetical protein
MLHHNYSCTRRLAELTKKLMNLMGNLCSAKGHSVQFFVQVFYTVKLHSLTESVLGALGVYISLVLIFRRLLFFTCCHSFKFTVPVSGSSSLAVVVLYVNGFC